MTGCGNYCARNCGTGCASTCYAENQIKTSMTKYDTKR